MTYQLIKKLLDQYIEKNHPDIDFYGDKEFEELSAVHGREYKRFVKSRPFCLYEKNIEIEREKYCKANPYNSNWLEEDEEEEAPPEQVVPEEQPVPTEDPQSSTPSDTVDMRKLSKKRRVVKPSPGEEGETGRTVKIFKCELPGCNRQYTSSFGLKYHMKEGHSEEKLNVHKPFVCPMDSCGRKYKNNNGLKYHLKNYHDIE